VARDGLDMVDKKIPTPFRNETSLVQSVKLITALTGLHRLSVSRISPGNTAHQSEILY
jgi:hypothetical protein